MVIMIYEDSSFPMACWQGGQSHAETWCYDYARRHESVWMVPGLWRGFQ